MPGLSLILAWQRTGCYNNLGVSIMPNIVKYFIAFAFLIGIGVCLYFISTGSLSAKEVALLSIVLTTLSILVTWIVTHIYSESQYRKAIQEVQESHRANLRTYALKAAEKVNNLSNQLSRLAAYLQESLDDTENDRIQEDLLAKQERIESAIHIINTLKSVNDTALSDWEGVIGDELDEQRELQAEREEELRGIVERLDAVSESQIYSQQYTQDSTQALTKEMDSLRKELRSVALSLGLSPVRLIKSRERKLRNVVESHCPECGEVIEYRQKKRPRSIKIVKCKACNAELISRYDVEKEFILEKRHIAQEQITCPSCKTTLEVKLDTLPNSSLVVKCHNCQEQMTITRTQDGIGIKAKALTEEIIESVKDSLPPQPWPKGVNKSVADKLGLSADIVSEAITKLIRRGVFKVQFDGKTYVPEPSIVKRKSQAKKTGESQGV